MKKTGIILIILCLCLTGCGAGKKWDKADKALWVAMVAGQVADGVSTSRGMDRGAVEMNTIAYGENPLDGRLILVKVGSVAVITVAAHFLPPKVRKVMLGGAAVLGIGLAFHNEGVQNDN